jgi:hypothetical protein
MPPLYSGAVTPFEEITVGDNTDGGILDGLR